MKISEDRGMVILLAIGIVGGFFGGNVLAPILGSATGMSIGFGTFSVIVALTSAILCVVVGSRLSGRFEA